MPPPETSGTRGERGRRQEAAGPDAARDPAGPRFVLESVCVCVNTVRFQMRLTVVVYACDEIAQRIFKEVHF